MGYANMVGQFVYETPVLRSYFDQLAENDFWLKSNGWQDGVKVVFYQASVPSGWTQDTSANDKFLRVVNNTGGNPGGAVGGSLAVSSGLSLVHDHGGLVGVGTHTHAGTNAHTHSMGTGAGSNSIGTNYPKGSGDLVISSFVHNAGAGAAPVWKASFLGTALDADASTAAGNHSHVSNSALSNVAPAYTDVIIGIKSTSSGYTDLTSFFNHNDRVKYEPFNNAGGLWYNDEFNNGRITPTGTVAVFYNSSSPAGWSKLTTQNDKALRIVSGAGGGSGGSLGTGQTIVLAHTHSSTVGGAHSHTLGGHRHNVATQNIIDQVAGAEYIIIDGNNDLRRTNGDGTVQNAVKGRTTKLGTGGTSGTDPDHTHTLSTALSNIILAYVDMIQCQKLSTGAPYAYQNLLGLIVYKKLVTRQRLNLFAANDEYIRYHTISSGSVMAFYQSATPLNWTVLSAQHDKVLRIVSGAGGGSGGGQLISNAIQLAHTHTIPNYTHSHSYPAHTHAFETNNQAAGSLSGTSNYLMTPDISTVAVGAATGVFGLRIKGTSASAASSTSTGTHNHGGISSSSLSNVTFAYANVILCQKN